jgi:hypothetical protein
MHPTPLGLKWVRVTRAKDRGDSFYKSQAQPSTSEAKCFSNGSESHMRSITLNKGNDRREWTGSVVQRSGVNNSKRTLLNCNGEVNEVNGQCIVEPKAR